MARGYPDGGRNPSWFGNYSTDVNELAARLGSSFLFDRTGHVIYQNDFENGLSSMFNSGVVDGAVQIRTDLAYLNSCSLKITPNTTGNGSINVGKTLPLALTTKAGYQLVFCRTKATGGTPGLWYVYIVYSNDSGYYSAKFTYDNVNQKLQLDDYSTGSLVTVDVLTGLPDTNSLASNPAWHWLKVVIDTTNNKYSRVQFDNRAAELTQYVPKYLYATNYGVLGATLIVDAEDTPSVLSADALAITMDEP